MLSVSFAPLSSLTYSWGAVGYKIRETGKPTESKHADLRTPRPPIFWWSCFYKKEKKMNKVLLFSLLLIIPSQYVLADEYTELVAYRDSLKQQIETVDSEIAKCEKSLKGWKAATIIGSVGAVASGIGIIAQKQQIKENKKVLNDISSEAKEADEAMKFIQKVKE